MIGTGPLPAAADAPAGTRGWVVPGATLADADVYYRLETVSGAPVWLRQSARLLRDDDPVITSGAVATLGTLASGAARAVLEQAFTAATVWILDHALPHVPSVTVLDAAGRDLHAQVERPTSTRVVVTHNGPRTGSLRLD